MKTMECNEELEETRDKCGFHTLELRQLWPLRVHNLQDKAIEFDLYTSIFIYIDAGIIRKLIDRRAFPTIVEIFYSI